MKDQVKNFGNVNAVIRKVIIRGTCITIPDDIFSSVFKIDPQKLRIAIDPEQWSRLSYRRRSEERSRHQ